jgi:alpha-tubulin suppressor-like RCC1 family protein
MGERDEETGISQAPDSKEIFTGSLMAWGSNFFNQLGLEETDEEMFQSEPKLIEFPNTTDTNFDSYSYGLYFGAAIQDGGDLYTWGSNDFGQCGNGNLMRVLTPTLIGSGFEKVSCGDYHTIAIKDYKLYSFGKNDFGQCGTGDRLFSKIPAEIVSDISFDIISCGSHYSCAIDLEGYLYTWGCNNFGQLGHETTKHQLIPVKVGTDKWENVFAGVHHTLAIKKSDKSLWGWGDNANNQLGLSGTFKTPTLINDEYEWNDASCGIYHSLAITSEGDLYSCGYNKHGQCGVDSQDKVTSLTQVTYIPERVSDTDNTVKFLRVGACGYFSLAIGYDGSYSSPGNCRLHFFGDNTSRLVKDEEYPKYILTPYRFELGFIDVIRGSHGGVFIITKQSTETEHGNDQ